MKKSSEKRRKNKLKSNIKWIYFVSKRFNKIEKTRGTGKNSALASVGIGIGVMALIVVMSVMNGFQLNFIDSIMEISSYHLRVKNIEKPVEFMDFCENDRQMECTVPFVENQGLFAGPTGKQKAAIVRSVPENILSEDKGFAKEAEIIAGSFDLSDKNSIVVGSTLARSLSLRVGSKVNIVELNGSTTEGLLSSSREYTVKGVFSCGYSDINSYYAFTKLSEDDVSSNNVIYGIKLKKSNLSAQKATVLEKQFENISVETWQEYNKSFFGALRMEKNAMFLLVFLIFIVVAVNIYNSMKKIVYQRKEEIAVLQSFGASKNDVENVFIIQGALTGIKGSVPGLLSGLFLTVNISYVFKFLSKIQYGAEYVIYAIFNHNVLAYLSENPMFEIYASIPARINPWEVVLIFMFGVCSALVASYLASREVLKMTVSEVLKNE